jgi:hypothetical protein
MIVAMDSREILCWVAGERTLDARAQTSLRRGSEYQREYVEDREISTNSSQLGTLESFQFADPSGLVCITSQH